MITDSVVISNTASGGAGFVVVEPAPGGPGGDLTLTASTICDNAGGGLYNAGTADIVRSYITGNTVSGGIVNSSLPSDEVSTKPG